MKMKLPFLLLLATFCRISAYAQNDEFSQKLDTTFTNEVIKVSNSLQFDILSISQDCTVFNPATNTFAPMKGSFGKAWYLPGDFSAAGESSGTIYLTHYTNEKNSALGDGGGLIKFKVKRQSDNTWKVVKYSPGVYFVNVDLSGIGGSVGDNDIIKNQYDQNGKTFLISEGLLQQSNTDLSAGMSNVSDYTVPNNLTQAGNQNYVVPAGTKLSRYQQMNWMVEVDAITGTPTQKLYTMGRFNHAYAVKGFGGYLFTTGRTPSVLFKWEPNDPDDLQVGGELFAFKQSDDTLSDGFISLNLHKQVPDGFGGMADSSWQSFDSLLVVEEQALRAGATMFANLSGLAIQNIDGDEVLYIAERGTDNSGDAFTNKNIKFNGVLAKHLQSIDTADGNADGVVHDYHGRILSLFPDSKLTVMIEGGTSSDGKYTLSNPESISIINGPIDQNSNQLVPYLIIKENINGVDHGRNPDYVTDMSNRINEAYWMKAPTSDDYQFLPKYAYLTTLKKKSIDNLTMFLAGPKGAAITGGSTYDIQESSEKNDTYFLSFSNPNPNNKVPYNRSMVIAVRGIWNQGLVSSVAEPQYTGRTDFNVWPNPATSTLNFNKITDVALYSSAGILMKVYKEVDMIDISGLTPGMYFLTNSSGDTKKIIIE